MSTTHTAAAVAAVLVGLAVLAVVLFQVGPAAAFVLAVVLVCVAVPVVIGRWSAARSSRKFRAGRG